MQRVDTNIQIQAIHKYTEELRSGTSTKRANNIYGLSFLVRSGIGNKNFRDAHKVAFDELMQTLQELHPEVFL